jgi:hypothetical protein
VGYHAAHHLKRGERIHQESAHGERERRVPVVAGRVARLAPSAISRFSTIRLLISATVMSLTKECIQNSPIFSVSGGRSLGQMKMSPP